MTETPASLTASDLRALAAHVPAGSDWATFESGCAALDVAARDGVPDPLRVRVALLASFTVEPLVAFLRIEGARLGVWVDTYVAPYNQIVQELLEDAGALHRFAPHATFVLLDGDTLWDAYWAAGARPDAGAVASGCLEPLLAGVDAFRRCGTGIVVVNDIVLPRPAIGGALAFRDGSAFPTVVVEANALLRSALAEGRGIYCFPLTELVAEVGRGAAWNRRTHYRGHLTWSDRLMAEAARAYAGYAAATIGRVTKCVVLDLDNTLWGGVLGEDGAAGIACGPQWPGREYLDFQRQLLLLQGQGILLALCSKNNEHEVIAVLRDHPELLIREEHLAAWRVNWEDKATNIRALAAELNLGLEQLLFLDDSPHERAWVREHVPELQVPELPADPTRYADWLGTLPSLVVLERTEEDVRRTEQYREQRVRERLRLEAPSPEAFLRSLNLRVRIEPLHDDNSARVAQLVAKTNQFNLTTRRHDESTLRRRMTEGSWRVYAMRVADRFGDFGLTGVAVVAPAGASWHIDSFLISCRVIGKSVETALLSAIAEEARTAGIERLTADFIDSSRNAPARDFLDRHGFAQGPDGVHLRATNGPGLEWPPWIVREDDGVIRGAASLTSASTTD